VHQPAAGWQTTGEGGKRWNSADALVGGIDLGKSEPWKILNDVQGHKLKATFLTASGRQGNGKSKSI
jgi:hypothetical protein